MVAAWGVIWFTSRARVCRIGECHLSHGDGRLCDTYCHAELVQMTRSLSVHALSSCSPCSRVLRTSPRLCATGPRPARAGSARFTPTTPAGPGTRRICKYRSVCHHPPLQGRPRHNTSSLAVLASPLPPHVRLGIRPCDARCMALLRTSLASRSGAKIRALRGRAHPSGIWSLRCSSEHGRGELGAGRDFEAPGAEVDSQACLPAPAIGRGTPGQIEQLRSATDDHGELPHRHSRFEPTQKLLRVVRHSMYCSPT